MQRQVIIDHVDLKTLMETIDCRIELATKKALEQYEKKPISIDAPLTTKDIMALFGLSKSTINKYRKSGTFPSFTIGRNRFFPREEIMNIMKERYGIQQ